MKRLGVFLLPPGWDASPWQGYPQHFAGTHLYNWVERGTVRVKCLAQEHNTMSPAKTRTRATRSGVQHTNYEATAPLTLSEWKGVSLCCWPVSLAGWATNYQAGGGGFNSCQIYSQGHNIWGASAAFDISANDETFKCSTIRMIKHGIYLIR